MSELVLRPGRLTLTDLRRIAYDDSLLLKLDPTCYTDIDVSAATVTRVLSEGRTVYGINTGFGILANTRILTDELENLQKSLILSHAVGVGERMPDSTVRLTMALKINSLARGLSGVRRSVIDALIVLFNQRIYPCIPQKGSVGASGDLAPLSHMSAVLIGEGAASVRGEIVTGADALVIAGLSPMVLAPKEGLALLNGTQVSTAFALEALFARLSPKFAVNCLQSYLMTNGFS